MRGQRQHEPRLRITDGVGEPRLGMRGIQRHVDRARLERAEHRGDLTHALGQEQGHRLVPPAEAVEHGVRDPVGGLIEGLIGQSLRAHRQGEAAGVAGDLLGESRRERALEGGPRERNERVGRSPVGAGAGSWRCRHRSTVVATI